MSAPRPARARGALACICGVLVAIVVVLCAPRAVAEACDFEAVTLRGDWGQARFTVEVVDTPETRAQGLMFREHLPRRGGMLFLYDAPQPVSFWMRNTLIPLDMIFVGADGVVTRVHENAVPMDETPIPGGQEVQAVLEVNAGIASMFGIAPGTEMRHEAFGADAAWPCP